MQDAKFVQRESPKHGGVIPQAFASRGWFWWTAHLLGVLLQPGPSLARAVAASLRSTGLGAALRDGAVLGMHVRHGDACLAGERVRMARTCSPLAEYMQQARPLTRALGVTTIYLATDSEQVLQDTRLFPEFRFLHLPNVSRFGVSAPAPTRLWDAIVKRRAKRPATRRRNHREAWMATVDALLLARCDAFVGKFTSTLFRTAYALQAAECDCAVRRTRCPRAKPSLVTPRAPRVASLAGALRLARRAVVLRLRPARREQLGLPAGGRGWHGAGQSLLVLVGA